MKKKKTRSIKNLVEAILALAERETAIKQEAAEKQTLLDDLLKTHASIEEKYNIARGKLENARQAFENIQKEAYYQNWRHESDERLQMLLAEQNRADNALKELRQWHPLADEIKRIDERLLQLDWTEKENTALQTAVKSQIAQITAEYEMKESEMKQASQHEQERLEADRTQIREQIAKIDELLARLDGSFYKWLCENKEAGKTR